MAGEPGTVVGLAGPGWRSGPLLLARAPLARFRGLRPRPGAAGLLLAARSVHAWGMAVPLTVISLDGLGTVRRVARLRPGRCFFDRGARWIVELPAAWPPPPSGMRLRVRPILGGCPGP